MIRRKIFKKRKSKKKIIYLIILLILIILFYFSLSYKNKNFIIISENKENFFIVPKDKGGKKVSNLDKKSLNLKSQENFDKNENIPEDLLFSIQIYTNNDLEKVKKYLDKITNFEETIYNFNDFYILSLNSDIGVEYFLLYKNFNNRQIAKNYCLEFLVKIENCLVVDTTKF